jgi:hypothetical protein
LKDAPRAWRIRLDRALRELGGKPLSTDTALYVWHDKNAKLVLILSTHVDDKKGAGEPALKSVLKQGLEKLFGTIKEQTGCFEHCGIMHEQTETGIKMHQSHYVKQLHVLDMSGIDVSRPGQAVTSAQHASYMSLLGGLSWLVQTRTDICVYVCALQRVAKAPNNEHYIRLNRLCKWVKRKPLFLLYKRLTGPLKVLAVSDSAFRKEDCTGLAVRGALILICELHVAHPGGCCHVIDYYSRKQRRVTRSTFAAELQGLADSLEYAKLVAFAVHECIVPKVTPRQLVTAEETGGLRLPIEGVVDAKSVFDALAVSDTRMPSENSLIMVLLQIKEMLRTYTLRRLWWCDTHDMVADGLNKGTVNRDALIRLSTTGEWRLANRAVAHSETVHVPLVQTASM